MYLQRSKAAGISSYIWAGHGSVQDGNGVEAECQLDQAILHVLKAVHSRILKEILWERACDHAAVNQPGHKLRGDQARPAPVVPQCAETGQEQVVLCSGEGDVCKAVLFLQVQQPLLSALQAARHSKGRWERPGSFEAPQGQHLLHLHAWHAKHELRAMRAMR